MQKLLQIRLQPVAQSKKISHSLLECGLRGNEGCRAMGSLIKSPLCYFRLGNLETPGIVKLATGNNHSDLFPIYLKDGSEGWGRS